MIVLTSIKVNDYLLYLPGSFLFIDFSFYNTIIIYGFISILDIIYSLTCYSFQFSIKLKKYQNYILK